MFLKKYKSWLITLAFTLGLAMLFYPVQNKYSQSFKFVDEEEYAVNGWLMGKNYKLYQDIFTNHQPVNYIASYAIQKLIPIDNGFMLIRRHRQIIFLVTICWWFILIKRFGMKMVFPIFLFENFKYFTLGNEFVAESITAYPLAYIFLSTADLVIYKKKIKEDFFLGVLNGLILLSLLPLAVPVAILSFIRYILLKGKGIWLFLGGLGIIFGLVFYFVIPHEYWQETIVNNYLYAIPRLSPFKQPLDYLSALALPFLYFKKLNDLMGQGVSLVTASWLITAGIYWFYGKKKMFWGTMGLLLIWMLTNTRVLKPNVYFYEAFHLNPWLASGLMVSLYLFLSSIKLLPKKLLISLLGVFTLWLGFVIFNQNMPMYTKINQETEHYIQFTPLTLASEIINKYKRPGDRLMVIPNEVLIHFLTGMEPPKTKLVTYYEWQMQVPKNRILFNQILKETPPAFIVYSDDGSSYSPSMNEYLKNNYIQLMSYPNVYINRQYQNRIKT